jgi:RNA polymerase-binding transcription factor DksA
MRQHFHRCGHLRVVTIDASDLNQRRRGGSFVVEELCEARSLAPCVGLAECDILAPAQKRELLGARATRLRQEAGGPSPLADVPDPRAAELEELRSDLLEERREIVEDNRRRIAEAGAAILRNPHPVRQESDLALAGMSISWDDEVRQLRTARLDAIDRALDALAHGSYGECVRCHQPIDTERLRIAPDTLLCASCARLARPDPVVGAASLPQAADAPRV